MLGTLTRTFRCKAAVFLAVLYAFTVLAPHAAMAFGNPEGTAHCLTASNMHDHGATVTHQHADGAEHTHAAPNADDQNKSSDDKGPAAACCGLFSASAMLTETGSLTPGPVTTSTVVLLLPDLVDGQGPARIIRPPIA